MVRHKRSRPEAETVAGQDSAPHEVKGDHLFSNGLHQHLSSSSVSLSGPGLPPPRSSVARLLRVQLFE